MRSNKEIQHRKIATQILQLFPLLFLVACGGGGSNTQNHAPTAKAGTDVKVFENRGVALTAKASYDEDAQDKLSYKWSQIEGKTITLVGKNFKDLKFVAPEVEANSNFKFRLDISDNQGASSSDEIEINVLNIVKEQSYQEVVTDKIPIKSLKSTVKIPLLYNIYPNTLTTTGLSVKIYWDDSKLQFKDIQDAFSKDYLKYSPSKVDLTNADNDKSTNRYTTISWINIKDGKWITPKLPLDLMTPIFNVKNNQKGSTYINIRSAFESPKVGFHSKSILIEL